MSSSTQPKRTRKTPEARRAEIVAAAAAVALGEGLECITVRRIADELGVRPGLISHYFPVAEDLVAEAFGVAASAELDDLIPADPAGDQALALLDRFLSLISGDRYDGMSRLWINARHLSRYRPTLRDRVVHQEAQWRDRLTGLVEAGVAAGTFRTGSPDIAAMQILVVMDGLGVDVNTDRSTLPPEISAMPALTAERALELPAGTLAAGRPDDGTTG
ncbi:TetR family transcriptional regulator C-terminal domain-containing protein [Streptacidiphilus fuscans]|uniref:TetR family transcriptional regulator C-terminal domain-containing protein n=1 Tax=Streptacidiphilus fuscans TaxID=2789292 RepID=A0A931B8H5_9ACTN|nr:TetR family transcriptional regulator C-terminal domain-containing protein [Streptacidiphilus fuscans]MBF9072071.1 TetR family transcriptional regulator C-terminal domain-containing protein [Streptacidiphilus fuscans]